MNVPTFFPRIPGTILALLFACSLYHFGAAVPLAGGNDLFRKCTESEQLPQDANAACCNMYKVRCEPDFAAREVGGSTEARGKPRGGAMPHVSTEQPRQAGVIRNGFGGFCDGERRLCMPGLVCKDGQCRKTRRRPAAQDGSSKPDPSMDSPAGWNPVRIQDSTFSEREEKIESLKRRLNAGSTSFRHDDTMTNNPIGNLHESDVVGLHHVQPEQRADLRNPFQNGIQVSGLSFGGIEQMQMGNRAQVKATDMLLTTEELRVAVEAEGHVGLTSCGAGSRQAGETRDPSYQFAIGEQPTVTGNEFGVERTEPERVNSQGRKSENDGERGQNAGALEETEDEQIADSIAAELEKNTDTMVDERLLGILDKAVSRAMDRYEDKALQDGSLLINVNDLAAGTSSKAKVQVPEKQRSSQQTQPLDPETRARDLNDQLFKALRKRLQKEVSPTMLDVLARALVYPGCGSGGPGQSDGSLGGPKVMNPEVPCDVVRWIRKHWFSNSKNGPAYHSGLGQIDREEL